MGGRADPGDCPICGAAHCSCTGAGPGLQLVQLPARDAAAAARPLVADVVQATLPPDHFTTGTYRGTKQKRG